MKFEFSIDKILILLTKIMVFTVPLFFLFFSPLQLGADNYGKYFFIGILTLILTSLFFAKQLYQNSLKIYLSPLALPVVLLLLSFFIASVLGANRFASFWGNIDNTSFNFLALIIFSLLYFLFFNLFDKRDKIISIFRVCFLLFSFFVPLAFIVVFFYSAQASSAYFRLLAGTAEDLSLYLVLIIIFSLSLYSSSYLRNKIFLYKNKTFFNITKIFYNTSIFLAVVLLIKINFLYAWWSLFFGSLFLIYNRAMFFKYRNNFLETNKDNETSKNKKRKKKILVPILLALMSLNYLFNFYLVLGKSSLDDTLVQYRQLNNKDSFALSRDVLAKNILFGVGLDNFDYAYSKYRNPTVNNDKHWDLRYNKAGNFFVELFVGGGIVSIFFLLLITALIFYYCLRTVYLFKNKLNKEETSSSDYYDLSFILVPIIFVSILNLLYYSTTANALFLLILFLAIFMRMNARNIDESKEGFKYFNFNVWDIDFENNKDKKLFVYFSFGLFLVLSLVYLTINTKNLIADTQIDSSTNQELQLIQSANFSPKRYQYNLSLAKILADKAKINIKKGNLETGLKYQIQAIDYLRLAQNIGKSSVIVQETAGVIYRDFSEGDDQNNYLAIQAFKKALELEPSNPVIATDLGNAFFRANDFEQSIYYFNEALSLKNNYNPAKLGLAKSLGADNKEEEALDILIKLSKETRDSNVYYELGQLYFNQDKYNKAQTAFSSAITLSPLYSNALFGLALTLEKTGENEQAMYYYKKVQRLNPGSLEIAEKIKKLENN